MFGLIVVSVKTGLINEGNNPFRMLSGLINIRIDRGFSRVFRAITQSNHLYEHNLAFLNIQNRHKTTCNISALNNSKYKNAH